MAQDDTARESVPLSMLVGNLDVLLENTIEVNTISLRRDETSGAGVILMVGMDDDQAARALELGFRTGKVGE